MKLRNVVVATLSLLALVILFLGLPNLAVAQQSVPGFETLRWGMSHDEFVAAMGGFSTFNAVRWDDNGQWIGGFVEEEFQFGGFTFKGGRFYFSDATNRLGSYSTH